MKDFIEGLIADSLRPGVLDQGKCEPLAHHWKMTSPEELERHIRHGIDVRRLEPLGYDAVVRLFARHLERLGLRSPEKTPHALRHTHATAMWEAGMRELSLQKRLGHASPDSTKMYTRVSDEQVLADYTRALENQR